MLADVRVRVPAKINLWLSVGPVGDDGFHPLATVFQAVSLYDEVTVTRRPVDSGPRLDLAEETPSIPTDERNLAWRAAALLAERTGAQPDVDIHIRKGIPVAGGMAGGSADAAATLLGAAALWGGVQPAVLHEVAAELGSDVPFALLGGTAVGTGRGTRLSPAMTRGSSRWVFAMSPAGLSTPAVYQRYDDLTEDPPAPRINPDLMLALRSGDASELGRNLGNDLQPAALSLRPHLRQLLEIGQEHGALGSLVSGSGPTCGFLVSDQNAALELGVALASTGWCANVRQATGPVPGAAIIGSR